MTYEFEITGTGGRIDAYLARVAPEHSRSFWQKMAEKNVVQVNGVPVKSSYTITAGDMVSIELPELPDFSGEVLPVIYEDADIVVVNKPAGMLTHAKGPISDEFTVADFVRPQTTDGIDTNRPGIVHRLDRGTSGVIVAARTPDAKRWLQKQFATRKVKKTYIALVNGHPKEPAATLQLPLERNPKKPQTFRVGGNGKAAETAYETLQVFKDYTLLKLMPHTGRTHQLRVHMAYLNCPIVGDEFYGKPEPKLGRMFLHAASLEITTPARERKVFEAPLPQELQDFIKTLV
jgi:23S rRNA pseudouridine1911/1915/1917 synthase